MRVGLIQKFQAVYRRRNEADYVANTAIDPIFGTPIVEDSGRYGNFFRSEEDELILPCQIYADENVTVRSPKGDLIKPDLMLLHHYSDLELMGLLNAENKIDLRIGDRLVRIETIYGEIVTLFSQDELFIFNLKDSGWGTNIYNPQRNLVEVSFTGDNILNA